MNPAIEKLERLLQRADLRLFPEIARGTSAHLLKISETDLALKVFTQWPCTEIGYRMNGGKMEQYPSGLSELHSQLQAAKAPVINNTAIISLRETASYQEGDYPYAIAMEHRLGLQEGLDSFNERKFADEYLDLVGRLHAHSIIISPQVLVNSRHRFNQALVHIPVVIEEKLVLMDWTNLCLVNQREKYVGLAPKNQEDEYSSRAFLLLNDLGHPYGFRPVLMPDCNPGSVNYKTKLQERVKRYMCALSSSSADKDFMGFYQDRVINYFQGEFQA